MNLFKALVIFLGSFVLLTHPAQADINVGTVYFDPPFVMSYGGGFDIDFMQLICNGLKQQCTFIPMEFNQLFGALDKGKIDLAISAISIPPHKTKKYMFSLPYKLSKGIFLVRKDKGFKSIINLQNKKIGIIKSSVFGGVFNAYIKNQFNGNDKLIEYKNVQDLVNALSQDEIDAAFVHQYTAYYWVQNGGNQFKTLGQGVRLGDGMAIMALKKSAHLIKQVNQQIKQIELTNEYMNLYSMYFRTQ